MLAVSRGAAANGGAQIECSRSERWKHAKKYAGQQRKTKREHQHAAIERYAGNRKKVFGQKQEQST